MSDVHARCRLCRRPIVKERASQDTVTRVRELLERRDEEVKRVTIADVARMARTSDGVVRYQMRKLRGQA